MAAPSSSLGFRFPLPQWSIDPCFSIYVGDLHPDVHEEHLYNFFTQVGPVRKVDLFRDRKNYTSLCHAKIEYIFPKDACKALTVLNHCPLLGCRIRLMWFREGVVKEGSAAANLFVKNLGPSIGYEDLESAFGNFGTILSCKIATDRYGVSKGFAFVMFSTDESAKSAIAGLNGSTLNGKKIVVTQFIKKSERKIKEPAAGSSALYVNHLDEEYTETELKEKFAQYGTVTSAVIMKDHDGRSRGFGFVNFESEVDALNAIKDLNGKKMGSKKWWYVAKHISKVEREKIRKAAYTGGDQGCLRNSIWIAN